MNKVIKETIENTQYKNWEIKIHEKEELVYFSVVAKTQEGKEIKDIASYQENWFLSNDMSFDQILGQGFLAVSTIERTILQGDFLYKGVDVFRPSKDIETLKDENETVMSAQHVPVSSVEEMRDIVKDVEYKDWEFRVTEENDMIFLQLWFKEEDTDTGEFIDQYSRKWILSFQMGETEVLNTCFLAVSTAIRHEIRENYLYQNERISNPHRNISKVVKNRQLNNVLS